MEHYTYRPKRFYIIVFALTWGFWALALAMKNNNAAMLGIMVVGLIVPAATVGQSLNEI